MPEYTLQQSAPNPSYHIAKGDTIDQQNSHIFEAQSLGLAWLACSLNCNVYIATSRAGLVAAIASELPELVPAVEG